MLKEFMKLILHGAGNEGTSPAALPLFEKGPVLSQDVTFGAHIHRQKGEVAKVVFTHRAQHIRRTIINNNGRICNFPGFTDPDEIVRHLENEMLPKPIVRFRTEFCQEPDGRFLMVWEVQPDGCYWEDEDGFGGTSDSEVLLYTHIDTLGRFTDPFRLYQVGAQNYITDNDAIGEKGLERF